MYSYICCKLICTHNIQLLLNVFLTMPGDDDVSDHRGQLPPFSAPKFNWNQDNLYKQFKSFKRVVEFASQGQYEKCSNRIKCGSIMNWLGVEAYPINTITCLLVRMTRRIQASCLMHLNVTLSLRGISFNHGMLKGQSIVEHSKPSQNSTTSSIVWPMTVTLQIRMKL